MSLDITIVIDNHIQNRINNFRRTEEKDPALILVSECWFLEIINSDINSTVYYTNVLEYKEDFPDPIKYRGIRIECNESLGIMYRDIPIAQKQVILFAEMPEESGSVSITGNYIPVYHYKK